MSDAVELGAPSAAEVRDALERLESFAHMVGVTGRNLGSFARALDDAYGRRWRSDYEELD